MAEKTASFSIPIKVDSNAREGAADLDRLRASLQSSQDRVKEWGAAMRSLRGASNEVKAARSDLRAKLEAEKDAISRSTVALLKQGTTHEKLKKQTDATRKAVHELGGPLATMHERFESLRTVLGGARTASGAVTLGVGALALGAVAATAAVVGLTAALVAGAAAFAHFVLEGANWNRTAALMREAASGSTANASALGHQIDSLAGRVATSRAELNEMALGLTRALLGSRVSGQGLVDTFNAVAQASAAMGSEAASKIQGIIDRSKTWGRMSLGLFELQGTGIGFGDVAANLAKQLKIGIDAARLQLFAGFVDVNQGAKAIRTAIEQRFARINLARMLDFDVLKTKFRDLLTMLTSGVDLTPFLTALQSLSDLFSASSVTGAALKDLVTVLGNALVGNAASGAELVKRGFQQMVIWGLQLTIAVMRARSSILDSSVALALVKGLALGVAAAFGFVAAAAVVVGAAVATVTTLLGGLVAFGYEVVTWAMAFGRSIPDGIVRGLRSEWEAVTGTVGRLADDIKSRFRSLLGIHSPSVVFRAYGEQTTAGYAQGLDRGTPQVYAAANAMAPQAPQGGSTSPARVGPVAITLQVNVPPGTHTDDVAKAMRAPDFLAELTKAFEEVLVGLGIPTQQKAGA